MTDPQHPPVPPEDQPVAPEPITPEPTAPEPVAPEPVAPEPVVPEPVAPEPVVPEPVAPEPVVPEPVAPEPVVPEPVVPEPVTPEPAVPDPVTPEPAPAEPVLVEPPTPQPVPAYETPAEPVDAAPITTEEPAPTQRRRSRAWLPVTAVGLAVTLLAGATGFLAWQLRQSAVAEDGRSDAVAAARDAARLLFSYNHETLKDDFEKGLAVTTGEFREEYSRTTTEVVSPVAEQYDAVVVAEVVEAAIIDAEAGKVTALVFLNQGTTSTRVEGQQVDQSRVRMHLVERDGQWLVEAVEAL